MQKPWAVNGFVIDDKASFSGGSLANSTIKSILDGGIGLPGVGAQLARRYGRHPIIGGLQRPGNRLNLTTYFCESDKATQRRNLLAELNPELEIAARLYAADQVAPEGLIAAFGPWDVYPDVATAWHCRSLLWSQAGDGELSARLEADITGAVNFRDGPNARQQAIVIEETTTNLVGNPSMETNVTGWSTNWGDALSQSDEQAKFGVYSIKVISNGGTSGTRYTDIVGLTPGNVVAVSAYIYVPGTNETLTSTGLRAWDGGGFTNAVTVFSSLTDEWEYLTLLKTVPAGGSIRVGILAGTSTTGDVSYLDAMQAEDLDHNTTYCDGSLGPGYSWTGTAHASTSTRAETEFNLDDETALLNGRSVLTIRTLARMSYDADADWPVTNVTLWEVQKDGNNLYELRFLPDAGDVFRFNYRTSGVSVNVNSSTQTFNAGDWIDITVTFDTSGNSEIHVSGVLEDTTDISARTPIAPIAWNLGADAASANLGNIWFAEYDVWDRVLDANEIAQMAANGTTHGRARYLETLCEASQPLVIASTPTPRGNVSTLAIDGDVRWRSRDGDVHFWSAYDDTWDQTITVDSDDDVWPIIRITPNLAKDAGTGFQYKSPVLVEWKAPSSAENYPVTFSLDTTTLNGAGKVQVDLDDLRVYVDGLETDRWLDSTVPSGSTNIWFNLDFSAHLEFDLKTAIAGAGAITEIELDDDENLTALPGSGLVLIDSEVFVYTGKNNFSRKLTGVTRAMRGTAAAAHTTADVVKWIQYDVLVVYGDSSLSAPVTDDDFKPILNLSTSTNDSWVYANFGEDDKPRAAAWASEIIQDPRPFIDNFSDFDILTNGSPWTAMEIDNLMYLGDGPGGTSGPPATGKVGEARWKVSNVCGITNANFQNLVGGSSGNVPDYDAAMQSSEDGVNWTREAGLSTGASPVNQALDAGGADKWVAMYSFCTVAYGDSSGTGNSADIEMSDTVLTLYNTLTPDTTVQAEETAYQVSAVLTNSTTSKALLINFIMDLDETLEINTYDGVVTYLLDSTGQQQAVRQQDGAKREWLPLRNDNNALEWADTGTNDLDLQFFWERRYWE